VSFHPTRARFKVYIVDEVHMLTTEAFNALLKTLEEPPAHVKFIFATTDPQKVPPDDPLALSALRLPARSGQGRRLLLRKICDEEKLVAEDDALVGIARAAAGGMRDAESLLEMLGTLGAGRREARRPPLAASARVVVADADPLRRARRGRFEGGARGSGADPRRGRPIRRSVPSCTDARARTLVHAVEDPPRFRERRLRIALPRRARRRGSASATTTRCRAASGGRRASRRPRRAFRASRAATRRRACRGRGARDADERVVFGDELSSSQILRSRRTTSLSGTGRKSKR